jgi:hypothetical protein
MAQKISPLERLEAFEKEEQRKEEKQEKISAGHEEAHVSATGTIAPAHVGVVVVGGDGSAGSAGGGVSSDDTGESVVVSKPTVAPKIVKVTVAPKKLVEGQEWNMGDKVEVEMTLKNDYEDTIHPAKVSLFDKGKSQYVCSLLAFDQRREESIDKWGVEFIHNPREAEPEKEWHDGDGVHFRLRNREVKGKIVDGRFAAKGIWVKGVIEKCRKEDVIVEHTNWEKGRMTSIVKREDLRSTW